MRALADAGDIPWVSLDKHDNKREVMRPHLARQQATGHCGVAAIGVAQEFQRVGTADERQTRTGARQFSFTKADRRGTCYYFSLWTPTSARRLSRCAPTSPTQPRSGRLR